MEDLSRRSLIAASLAWSAGAVAAARRLPSPFSIGEERPRVHVPKGACDSHIHILDPRFPAAAGWSGEPVNEATVAAYHQYQARIGTSRVVVVTPSTYGADNRATLDALKQFGATARGVIVIDSDAPPHNLRTMMAAGVRGIRVNFVTRQPWGQSDQRRLVDTARIAADLGWHIQIYAKADQIDALESVIAGLPTPVVIDHLGYLAGGLGKNGHGHAAILRLLDNGRTWMKLSGAYISSVSGPPSYADLRPIAQSYVRAAPERLVWGSDWPHRGQNGKWPDDAQLIDLLADWAPNSRLQHRILVENPYKLYGFA